MFILGLLPLKPLATSLYTTCEKQIVAFKRDQLTPMMPPGFLSLPDELLLLIASPLPPARMNNLIQAHSHFYRVLNDILWAPFLATGLRTHKLLEGAARNGNSFLVKKLIDDHDAGTRESFRSAIEKAAVCGHVDVLTYLTKRAHAQLGESMDCGQAIGVAAWKARLKAVQILLMYPSTPALRLRALQQAILVDHEGTARAILSKCDGIDVNAPVLKMAMSSSRLELVALLLDNVTDINMVNNQGETLLFWPVHADREDLARLVLDRGVDVNARDSRGETVLRFARSDAVAHLLLQHGANVNEIEWTAEIVPDMLRLLRRLSGYGPTIDMIPGDKTYLLYQAARGGIKEYVSYFLCSGADVNGREYPDEECTALHCAASTGNTHIVRILLDHGALVNPTRIADDATPLHLAATKGNAQMVELLLSRGADFGASVPPEASEQSLVYEGAECNLTTFHCVAFGANSTLWQTLLDQGYDIPEASESTVAELLSAAYQGRIHHRRSISDDTMVRTILDSYTTADGAFLVDSTATLQGVLRRTSGLRGDETIIPAMLAKGADTNITDPDGDSLVDLATNPFSKAIFRALVSAGADLNTPGAFNYTPLHKAVRAIELAATESLLQEGAQVNVLSAFNETPLQSGAMFLLRALEGRSPAPSKEAFQIIMLLVEHGADPNVASPSSRLSLFHSIVMSEYPNNTQADVVRFLLNAGADIDMLDVEGRTPLRCASEVDNYRFMVMLLERGADPNMREEFQKVLNGDQ